MIVIPMAGLSQRFTLAGYERPKYMLEAHGMSLFDHAVLSFASYFGSEQFLFIARDVSGTGDFVANRCEALGIADFKVVLLETPTRGQAETVSVGLSQLSARNDSPITIFNIDTFRPGYQTPQIVLDGVDGYLETFAGEGKNWSFVRPESETSDRAVETSEKRPISDFCCTGLYYFRKSSDFHLAYANSSKLSRDDLQGGELYVAPLYNHLIALGRDIRFTVIPREDVVFCGVPAEYEEYKASGHLKTYIGR